ncbi:hypothetical protein GTZ99_00510 [Novosphingobium sp. FSY-8]|uniref:Secreted protein n=1 Tax=Novosphingobium ovatum TaxID=1908523 RepID=A0ABW9X924_9SPHN|nr:hypothetical protein [Novosphingobium ovatum]NBC35035.1 hypothetical protein [Novosphingobium ovatum]
MKPFAPVLTLMLIAGGMAAGIAPSAQAQGGPGGGPGGSRQQGRGFAQPSDLIAAEIAATRLASDKGQAYASAQTSVETAQMFAGIAPTPINRKAKKVPDPATALTWGTQQVWMACDGSYGGTAGAWRGAAAQGWYATIWQRQKVGGYKWVLRHMQASPTLPEAPEWIDAVVGDCPRPGQRAAPVAPQPDPAKDAPVDHQTGQSRDGTFAWDSAVMDGARVLHLRLKRGGEMTQVLTRRIAP